MKIHSLILGAVAGCVLGAALPLRVTAAVSDEDFNALKNVVAEQSQKIKQLEQQLGETHSIATNTVEKVEASSKAQPLYYPPSTAHAAVQNFTMVGDAEIPFGKVDGSHAGFAFADFAPIFLYRTRDDVLFEAGFDVALANNATNSAGASTGVDLSFAQLDYFVNDYITFVGGYMILPLGTYVERGAGWLNKMPDDPLPRSILIDNGAGVQLRGAIPIRDSGQHLTYAVYIANGPGSVDGSGNSDQLDTGGNVGIGSDGSFGNLHSSPGGGGRLGWFYPFNAGHYDLEVGVSGQTGPWDNAGNHQWSAAVLDASLHLGPNIEVRGEYMKSWYGTDDIGMVRAHGWWVQGGYKLTGLNIDCPVVNNTELVGRYDTVNDGLGTHVNR